MGDKRRAVLVGIGLLIAVGAGLCFVTVFAVREVSDRFLAADNTPSYFRQFHGVDLNSLEALSHDYGIEVVDFPKFGRRPFPINYVRYRLGWVDDLTQKPIAHRRDVESLTKGFVSKCQIDNTISLYLFYSDRVAPRAIFSHDSSALVMEVTYKLDPNVDEISEDQVLEDISQAEVGDDSRLMWKNIAPKCRPPARTS